jgi:transposase
MAKKGTLAKCDELQPCFHAAADQVTIGIDLGDKYSHCCLLGADGVMFAEGRVRSTPEAMEAHFKNLPPSRIAIEVGGHSRWVSQIFQTWGHEVVVANPRNLPMITSNIRKSDRVDAHLLARLARVDPQLLSPVSHRDKEHYPAVAQLRARDLLVRARTRIINAVRGISKATGLRIPACSSPSFSEKAAPFISDELKPSLAPLLDTIAHLSQQICCFDKEISRLGRQQYPETAQLRQISGVGPVTALEFVLTIGNPKRFVKSRDVGPYLGLTPRRDQSGNTDQQLKISKAGNKHLRSLLVQCAQYLLGRFSPDSDLKRWGMKLASRGGKNGKKRAITAVARKLAVLLHHLWVTGDVYEPLHNAVMSCPNS